MINESHFVYVAWISVGLGHYEASYKLHLSPDDAYLELRDTVEKNKWTWDSINRRTVEDKLQPYAYVEAVEVSDELWESLRELISVEKSHDQLKQNILKALTECFGADVQKFIDYVEYEADRIEIDHDQRDLPMDFLKAVLKADYVQDEVYEKGARSDHS